MNRPRSRRAIARTAVLLLAALLGAGAHAAGTTLLNVSYDPTRELYQQYDAAFAAWWKAKTGDTVTVRQSHGGSGKQARSVIDGLDADVVTLALAYDIDEIAANGKLVAPDWQKHLAHNSSPYTSTYIFLVRKGNPKGIHDWSDLVRPGVSIVTANPKTSGGRALGLPRRLRLRLAPARRRRCKAKDFVARLFRQVRCSTPAPRGSTVTFAERGIGDVLLAWENEAHLAIKEFGAGKFDIVYPPTSILAEPPGGGRRQGGRTGAARGRWRRPISSISIRPRARRSRPGTSTGRPTRRWLPDTLRSSQRWRSSPSTRCSAAGPTRRRRTSPTAACSTRSTARK